MTYECSNHNGSQDGNVTGDDEWIYGRHSGLENNSSNLTCDRNFTDISTNRHDEWSRVVVSVVVGKVVDSVVVGKVVDSVVVGKVVDSVVVGKVVDSVVVGKVVDSVVVGKVVDSVVVGKVVSSGVVDSVSLHC
jgi:hypothetical protein